MLTTRGDPVIEIKILIMSSSIPFSVTPGIEVVRCEDLDLPDGCHFISEGDEPGFIPGGTAERLFKLASVNPEIVVELLR